MEIAWACRPTRAERMTPSRYTVVEHKHIPGLVDVIKVDQPAGILQIARDGTLDRAFGTGKPFLNSLLVRRILGVLSYDGHRFPTMSARQAVGRGSRQDAL